MSDVIELKPATARKLLDLSESKGISVEELVRAAAAGASSAKSKKRAGGLERARVFRAWADGHSTSTPLLSDEAVSRKSIYGG